MADKGIQLLCGRNTQGTILLPPENPGQTHHAAPAEALIVVGQIVPQPSEHDLPALTIQVSLRGEKGIVDPAHAPVQPGVEPGTRHGADVVLASAVVGNEQLQIFV